MTLARHLGLAHTSGPRRNIDRSRGSHSSPTLFLIVTAWSYFRVLTPALWNVCHLPLWMKCSHFRHHSVHMWLLWPFLNVGAFSLFCFPSFSALPSKAQHKITDRHFDTLQMRSWKCKSRYAKMPAFAREEQKCPINNSYYPQTSWKKMYLKYRSDEFIWRRHVFCSNGEQYCVGIVPHHN